MPAVQTRRDTPRQTENEYVHGAFVLSRSLVSRLGWSRSLFGFLRPSQRVSLSLARKTRASMYTLVQLVYRCVRVKTGFAMWSNERELQFLEYYQMEPILWDSKHVKHKDKQGVHDAWMRVSERMEISVAELKKKRDSLMATYRSHKRKILASMQSGAAAESVYKPIWFAFDFMDSFLNDIFQCRKTMNTYTQVSKHYPSYHKNF